MTLTRITSDGITDAAIVNADINASAAIAGTKISPDFGSQNVVTTGNLGGKNLDLLHTNPTISLTDSNNDDDFQIKVDSGLFKIIDATNTADRFQIASDGTVDITGNLDVGAGLDVTGTITTTSTIEASNHIQITHTQPSLYLTDSNDNPDYVLRNNGGQFIIRDDTSGATRLAVNSDGHLDIAGNTDFGAGIDVTGAIKSTGNVSLDNSSELGVFETDTSLGFSNSAKLSFDFSSNLARIRSSGNGSFSARPLTFNIVNTEAMRIDTSGNVGIGTTSPNVLGNDAQHTILSVIETSGTRRGQIEIGDNQNVDQGGIGDIHFVGHYQDANHKDMASIRAVAEGSTSGQRGSSLLFETKANGTASIAERMRIDSSGFITQKFTSNNSSSAEGLFINNLQNTTGNNASLIFSNDSGERKKAAISLIDTGNYGAGDLIFALDGADSGELSLANDEKMRIDSSGRVGIGVTSANDTSSALTIKNMASGSEHTQLEIICDDNETSRVTFSETSTLNNGSIRYNFVGDARAMTFHTNGNDERMRIDSSGRVGIKNTNMSSFNNGMDDLVIGNGVSNTSPGMTIFSHATDIGTISFRDSADTGISGLIQYRHNESPPYMRFMVEGTQRMNITTHGGIAFNSDTAAANTLDDYEEGTFTPTQPTIGTNSASGTYTKIGRQVTASIFITLPTNSSGHAFVIDNMPFTSTSSSGTFKQGGYVMYTQFSSDALKVLIHDNSTRMQVYSPSGLDIPLTNLDNQNFRIQIHYTTG